MKLPTSSFYYRPKHESVEEKETQADLIGRIEAICLEFPRYGYRRVTAQLKREKLIVNHKRTLRLMRESDLLCRVKRRWINTTDSRHGFPRYLNLVKDVAVSSLNQVWLADITYIRIRDWLCLFGCRPGCFLATGNRDMPSHPGSMLH